MNSFVMLLVATAATGADPQPVVGETVTTVSSSSYTETAPEARPGLIDRIRNVFSSKPSSTSMTYPAGTFADSAAPVSGPRPSAAPVPLAPSVISGPAVAAPTRRFAPSGSSAEPPLADETPVTTSAPAAAPPPAAVPLPTYTYPAAEATGATETNRPRLFGRIRKLFGGSSSQPSQALPVDFVPGAGTVAPSAPVQRSPIGNP